jgi:gas vesicle protein
MSNNNENSVAALLIGAAIGVGLGILFAPEKGSKTREKIKDGFDDATDTLKQTLEDATDQWKNKVENSKQDVNEIYEDLLSNLSHKTEDVISFLEKKLADLKEKNKFMQNDN